MEKLLKNFVGIDISKPFFDAALIRIDQPATCIHSRFAQSMKGFKQLLEWLNQHQAGVNAETVFCMEYTGLYNNGLVNFLQKQKAQLWVEMPLKIKRSSGLQRGGDDKIAATKIAWYAFRYQDKMQLWRPLDSNIVKIRHLIAQRDRIVTAIQQLSVPLQELAECGGAEEAKELQKLQQNSLKALEKSKQAIEERIEYTVQQDKEINKKVQQVKSVKGIGQVTAVAILAYTKGFTGFSKAKQLACHFGVVPFNDQSGISVRSKPSVSPYANKKLKTLLHLCALSAIQYDEELRAYFTRKVKEGKNKMSVINAVRNKLIHRVFAVLRDDRFFVENYQRKCA